MESFTNLPSLHDLNRELATRNLLDFTKYTMPEYKANWHHVRMCEYLDRFAKGEIKRLMMFMPPGHGKSELVSRRLPAYLLGKNPKTRIISASYGADLARRMNRDVQRIIDHDLYRDVFPNTRLFGKNIRTVATGSWLRNSDLFEVVEYGGYYRGSGVAGAITGMRMDFGIIDDPFKNRKEADSQVVRDGVWDWYTSTFRTRRAGKDSGICLTLTRWHEDDLAGRLLELQRTSPKADKWTILSLPAIAEEPLADDDVREIGQALWPGFSDEEDLEGTKASIDEYEWSSLYQQRPAPAGGALFKTEWWDAESGRNRYAIGDQAIRNQVVARWQMWDTAFKDKDGNDFSCCSTWELSPDYRIHLRHVWKEKIDSAFLPDKMTELAQDWNFDEKLTGVVVEDKGSGTTSIQTLRRTAPEWLADMIIEFTPHGTKEYRARQASVWCQRDCVVFPWPDESIGWYMDCIDDTKGELFKFPNGKNDDFVDTLTMAIIYLENFLSTGWHGRRQTG